MVNKILNIGFCAVCLAPLFGFDTEVLKLDFVAVLALILCLRSFFSGSFSLRSEPLFFLMVALPFSIWKGLDPDYKPYLIILCYFGMCAGLSRRTALKSLPVILWCGFIMAMYGIFQFFGFESVVWLNVDNPNAVNTPSYYVLGLNGNPTFLGAFLAMLVPLAIYQGLAQRKYLLMALVMSIAVFMTKSDMAIGSMICSLISIPFWVNRKMFLSGIAIAIGILLIVALNWGVVSSHINSSGRFDNWHKIVKIMDRGVEGKVDGVVVYKKFNLFGLGAGVYDKYVKPQLPGNFNTCHNEYLQIYVEFGIVTLILFMLFLAFEFSKETSIFFKASMLCICLNACGLFVWQLALTQFLSVYLLCLNKDA